MQYAAEPERYGGRQADDGGRCYELPTKSRAALKRKRYSMIGEKLPENFDILFFFCNNC